MSDDIDNILDELSENCPSEEKKSVSSNCRSTNSRSRLLTRRLSEDLSDILKELDEESEVRIQPKRSVSVQFPKSTFLKKCADPLLGGTETHTVKLCDRLRCLSCDSAVISMDGFRWNDDVDYLFLRTNYPQVRKLQSRLISSRPSRAYACQCSHLQADSLRSLQRTCNFKWICTGHE